MNDINDDEKLIIYYGLELNDQSLTPSDNPHIGPTCFKDWLKRSLPLTQVVA